MRPTSPVHKLRLQLPRNRFLLAVLATLIAVGIGSGTHATSSASAASSGFTRIDLGTLGSDGDSYAIAINNNGQVIGGSCNGCTVQHAFSWTQAGGIVDIGTLGGDQSHAIALNDNGEVVGYSNTPGNSEQHAFSWTQAGGMKDLGTLGGTQSFAAAVNANGEVAGYATTPGDVNAHAVYWTPDGQIHDIGTLGGSDSWAGALNDSGQIVGYSRTTGDAALDGFSWTPAGGMVDLSLGGDTSYAVSVSNDGQVTGYGGLPGNANTHAFSWTQAGGIVDIGTLPGETDSTAAAINNNDQVVGQSNSPSVATHGFLWTQAGGMTDLGTLASCPQCMSSPAAVSGNGQVVGQSSSVTSNNGSQVVHAFSWTQSGGMVDLTFADLNSSSANAVNDNGEVVGRSFFCSSSHFCREHATLWEPPPPPPPPDLVTRNGTQLLVNGQPFRPVGLNIYNANSSGNCWYDLAHGSTLDDSLSAIGPGKNVLRAWFFQDLAMANGQRDWSAFDHTLAVAHAHGYKVIATLANQWADCEPQAGYKSESWYTSGYKQPDPGGTVSYRDWVQEVAARYKNDPTVMAWQLVNEPEILPQQGGDCGTVPESTAVNVLSSFAADVSGAIKAVDPNHLISLGTIGGGQCGAQGADYKTVMSVPTLDLCEFHDYTPSQLVPGDQFNGLQVRINQCNQLGKPILVGELGVKPSDVGGTFAARANTVASKLCAQLSAGVAGVLLWAWDKDGSLLDNFDIGPGDPVLDALSPWSDPSHTCSPPSAPSIVAAAAGDQSALVSWSAPASDGGAPISSYTVTPSPGGQPVTTNAQTTTATVNGLTNGTAYTFTVTATNAVGTSAGSSATAAVTPKAGNTAASGIASTSSQTTVSTGSDPSTSGGLASSVSVPAGTNGGAVTITQTATNQTAPAGYLFGNVQADISAPSGTAANPLTLRFTLTPPSGLAPPPDPDTLASTEIFRADTGTPTLVPDCPVAGQALPDGSPCV